MHPLPWRCFYPGLTWPLKFCILQLRIAKLIPIIEICITVLSLCGLRVYKWQTINTIYLLYTLNNIFSLNLWSHACMFQIFDFCCWSFTVFFHLIFESDIFKYIDNCCFLTSLPVFDTQMSVITASSCKIYSQIFLKILIFFLHAKLSSPLCFSAKLMWFTYLYFTYIVPLFPCILVLSVNWLVN